MKKPHLSKLAARTLSLLLTLSMLFQAAPAYALGSGVSDGISPSNISAEDAGGISDTQYTNSEDDNSHNAAGNDAETDADDADNGSTDTDNDPPTDADADGGETDEEDSSEDNTDASQDASDADDSNISDTDNDEDASADHDDNLQDDESDLDDNAEDTIEEEAPQELPALDILDFLLFGSVPFSDMATEDSVVRLTAGGNDYYFDSLALAFAAINQENLALADAPDISGSKTLLLLKSFEEPVADTIALTTDALTLNLNGYTLEIASETAADKNAVSICVSEKFELIDSKNEGNGSIILSSGQFAVSSETDAPIDFKMHLVNMRFEQTKFGLYLSDTNASISGSVLTGNGTTSNTVSAIGGANVIGSSIVSFTASSATTSTLDGNVVTNEGNGNAINTGVLSNLVIQSGTYQAEGALGAALMVAISDTKAIDALDIKIYDGTFSGEFSVLYQRYAYYVVTTIYDGVFNGNLRCRIGVNAAAVSKIDIQNAYLKNAEFDSTEGIAAPAENKVYAGNTLTSPGTGEYEGYTRFEQAGVFNASAVLSGDSEGAVLSPAGQFTAYGAEEVTYTLTLYDDYELAGAQIAFGDAEAENILAQLTKVTDYQYTYTVSYPTADYTLTFEIAYASENTEAAASVTSADGELITPYPSLSAAVNALQAGETLTLLADITRHTPVIISADNITLNLNGKKLTMDLDAAYASGYALQAAGNHLTFMDSAEAEGTGALDLNGNQFAISLTGAATTFVLESGSITGYTRYGIFAESANMEYSVYVKGGTMHGSGVSLCNRSSKFYISGGHITTTGDNRSALSMEGTYVNIYSEITGGTLIAEQGNAAVYCNPTANNADDVILRITGGTIINKTLHGVHAGSSRGTIEIGGSAQIYSEGSNALYTIGSSNNGQTLTIFGSPTFSGASEAFYIANGTASNSIMPAINISGGYFRPGSSAYLPISNTSYVTYTDDTMEPDAEKVLDVSPQEDGVYEGYYTLTTKEALKGVNAGGQATTYQEFDNLNASLETAAEYAEAGNTDGKYPSELWSAFTAAHTLAQQTLTNANANQAEINYRTSALISAFAALDASLNLDLSTLADGTYEVGVTMYTATFSEPSMANNAVDSTAVLEIDGDVQTLKVGFHPANIMGLTGHMANLWLYDGAAPELAATNASTFGEKREVKYDDYYKTDVLINSDPADEGYRPGTAIITLPYFDATGNNNRLYMRISVDVMTNIGVGDQNVILYIQYSTLEAIDTRATLSLDTDMVSLIAGNDKAGSQTVTAKLLGTEETPVVTWESADPSIAAVSADGIITALAAGETIVTASAQVGEDTVSQDVMVYVAASDKNPVAVSKVTATGSKAVAEITGDVFTTVGAENVSATSAGITIRALSGSADVTASEVRLSESVISAVDGKSITIENDVSAISFSAAATTQIAGNESGAVLSIAQTALPSALSDFDAAYTITLTDSSGQSIAFDKGTAQVSTPYTETPTQYFAYHVEDNKLTERIAATTGGGSASFATSHFSLWALSWREYELGDTGKGNGNDVYILENGNYYVDIELWKANAKETSMGDIAFENNRRALVTMFNGKATTVQLGTNPVEVDGYYSAITRFSVDSAYVTYTELEPIVTIPEGNEHEYVKGLRFSMPDAGQPTSLSETTYVPVTFVVPDTPMDGAVGETLPARIRFTWSSATLTDDSELVTSNKKATGVSILTGEAVEIVDLMDEATGISLLSNTNYVSDQAVLSVAQITEGRDFDLAAKLMEKTTSPYSLYQIILLVNGKETAPEGSVNLYFPCESELIIYRINDDGTRTLLQGAFEDGYYVIATSALGHFAIIGELTEPKLLTDLTDSESGIQLKSYRKLFSGIAKLASSVITSGEIQEAAKASIGNAANEFTLYRIFAKVGSSETTYLQASGKLYFPITAGADANKIAVYAEQSDGTFALLRGAVEDGYYVVTVTGLGHFVFAELTNTVLDRFTDLNGHWAREHIATVVERGLFSGTSDTLFSPEAQIDRAMFVTVLGRMAGVSAAAPAASAFADVPADAYYAPYAAWAAENGIASGTAPGVFSPSRAITREEMAVMLHHFALLSGVELPNTSDADFSDADEIATWAKPAVDAMVGGGVISGITPNRFAPSQTATRAEAAALIAKYISAYDMAEDETADDEPEESEA